MNTAYEDEPSVIKTPWKVLVVDYIKIHEVLWHLHTCIYIFHENVQNKCVGMVVTGSENDPWGGGGGRGQNQYMHCRI